MNSPMRPIVGRTIPLSREYDSNRGAQKKPRGFLSPRLSIYRHGVLLDQPHRAPRSDVAENLLQLLDVHRLTAIIGVGLIVRVKVFLIA